MTGIAVQTGKCFSPAYTEPATAKTSHPMRQTMKKLWSPACLCIFTIVASAATPPPNLARLVAHRESEAQAERNQYTYRQSVRIEELNDHGAAVGEYRE